MTDHPEDHASIIYGEGHRYITIDVASLSPTGILIKPGSPPPPEPLVADGVINREALRRYWTEGPGSDSEAFRRDFDAATGGSLRAGGAVIDRDGIRIDNPGDDPEPEFPEVSGRLVRNLRRLFDEYGEMGTIMVAAKISPSAMILCAEQPIDWHPAYADEITPEPEPSPEPDILDRLVDREALAAVSQQVAKIGQALVNALSQTKAPTITLTLTPETQASLDAMTDLLASSLRVTRKGPPSPRQD